MRPVVIRGFLLALSRVSPGRRASVSRCPRLWRASSETPHSSLCYRVARCSATPLRFQRGGVDADRLSFDQAGRTQALQHQGEDGAMRLQIDQPSRARNRRVVGRPVLQTDAQKVAQGERMRGSPERCRARNRCLRSNQSTTAGSKSPAAGWDGPSCRRRTWRKGFGEVVEPLLAQQLVQSPIERVTRGRRQVRRGDPQRRLTHRLAFPHCHAQSVVLRADGVDHSTTDLRHLAPIWR